MLKFFHFLFVHAWKGFKIKKKRKIRQKYGIIPVPQFSSPLKKNSLLSELRLNCNSLSNLKHSKSVLKGNGLTHFHHEVPQSSEVLVQVANLTKFFINYAVEYFFLLRGTLLTYCIFGCLVYVAAFFMYHIFFKVL